MRKGERQGNKMEPEFYMNEALCEARKAYSLGEVPVGAIIEKDGEIIGRGHNLTETEKDPTLHAEMIAIRQAAAKLGGWRLSGCRLYVTTEPCSMCAGAIVLARIETLFIGTMDKKAGACGSLANIPQDTRLNHNVEIETGLLQEECAGLLKAFFRDLRSKNKKRKQQLTQEDE